MDLTSIDGGLLSWLTEGRPAIASQDGASSGAILPWNGRLRFFGVFLSYKQNSWYGVFGALRASLAPRGGRSFWARRTRVWNS